MGAAGGMDELVELADHAVTFELAHGVERHQTIRVAIGDRRIVTGVDGVIFVGVERVTPVMGMVVKRVGRPDSILSGLPSGTKPPSVTSAMTADLRFVSGAAGLLPANFGGGDLGIGIHRRAISPAAYRRHVLRAAWRQTHCA